MITLQNETLRVEIAEPGEHPNDGVRFDRAGFITEVILNNERHFCANEPKNLAHPSTGGRGLCCEIKLDLCDEAKVGERYPKLGVGLIKKEEEAPYCFFAKYDIDYFPVTFSADKTSVEFVTEPIPCMGYAVRQKKKISICDNTLTVEYYMENVGEKTIDTQEYCHNFISIDGMAVSPDYVISTPQLRDYGNEAFKSVSVGHEGEATNIIGNGHGFTFAKNDVEVSLAAPDLNGISNEVPFKWSFAHKGAKAHIDYEESYVPDYLAIWTADHIVSPEFMSRITLAPGESTSWSRKLTFVDEM